PTPDPRPPTPDLFSFSEYFSSLLHPFFLLERRETVLWLPATHGGWLAARNQSSTNVKEESNEGL
ncbi:MAG: hypothetical protein ACK55S_02605, partial [Planctomycetota bacterium]